MNPLPAMRTLAFRPGATCRFTGRNSVIGVKRPAARFFADDKSAAMPESADAAGPNMAQAEHVSEEAAKMAEMTGGSGPDMSQGTPVQDVCTETAASPGAVLIMLHRSSKTTRKQRNKRRKS